MALPRRFQPLLDQARTQADLQYGSQGNLLAMLLDQAGHDLKKGITQSQGGAKVLQAGLERSRAQLPQNFQAAGLDPGALPQSPDGNRIRETLANALSEISLREAQAQEGAASGIRQARDQYSQDASKIKSQLVQLMHDRGAYTASTLDSLIGSDRASRHAARMEALKTQNAQEQSALDRAGRVETALIGQGIAPDGSALPGGKADPNAKKKAAKKSPWDKTEQKRASDTIEKALTYVHSKDKPVGTEAQRRAALAKLLVQGSPGSSDPLTGQTKPGIPSLPAIYVSAALDLYFGKALSRATINRLHERGVKIKPLGYPTETAPRTHSRPANAPGANGQLRPT